MYLGRHEEADANFRESIAVGETLSAWIAMDYSIFTMNLWMQRRFDDAESLLAGLPIIKPLVGTRDDKLLDIGADLLRVTHARLKLESGNAAGALRLLPGVDKYGSSEGEEHALVRGSAMCALGQAAEGLRHLDEYLQGVAPLWWQFDPDLARARAVAGLCALAAGDRSRAIKLADQAREALQKQPGLSVYFRAASERLDRQLLSRRSRR